VPWQDAGNYVGQVITVEGTVASAHVAAGACTLEFAPDDPSALRVVLVLSLFSAPAAPERLYAGRRVRASGRVQKFEGRPEMILRRADQIEVMDEASTTTTTTAP
jgi:DNA/RNA endonuclease YhcR with UshA esterase domain